MDPNMLQLVVCAALSLLGIIVTALIWTRAKWRTVVWWLGLSLLPLAVYFLGLVPHAIDGWNTLVGWYLSLSWVPLTMVGAGLAGLSVLLMVVSRFIPARPRTRKVRASDSAAGQITRQRPVYDSTPTATGGSTASGATGGGDDVEVTEILKRRGIE